LLHVFLTSKKVGKRPQPQRQVHWAGSANPLGECIHHASEGNRHAVSGVEGLSSVAGSSCKQQGCDGVGLVQVVLRPRLP
jgi:hypothetical protein